MLSPEQNKIGQNNAIRRLVLIPSWIIIGLTVLLSFGATLYDMEWPIFGVYIPLIASLILFGLPHGAADHFVLLRLKNHALSFATLSKVILPYLGISALYLAIWFAVPWIAFIIFILMTWFHWGQGDLHALVHINRVQHLSTRMLRAMALFIRGALPMLIPLLAFPTIYLEVGMDVTSIMAPSKSVQNWMFSPTTRSIGAGFLMLLISLYAILAWTSVHKKARRAVVEDLFEVALLTVCFASVHPLLSIGIYFCFWHAPRHIARILDGRFHIVEKPANLIDSSSVKTFIKQALPTTLIAICLLAVLYQIVPARPEHLPEWIGLYLILIAILTAPHIWVVCLMDQQDKIWQPVE